jgi:adenine-specific DNA-methyltransferase
MATLNFKGKPFVQNYHLQVKYHQLIPRKEKSLTNKVSLHDNLIIHGDNLKALKALLPTYAGKIKCIYIDPPYNTGNEKWVYNDNVNSPMMQEWLGKVVDKEDLTRHDKWLCMMTPRLKLLRELLTDDGLIFVSIDDNEVHRLRMLMDDIFGEENFLAVVVWQKVYSPRMDAMGFSQFHDFILVYGRTSAAQPNKEVFDQNKEQFKFFDEKAKKWYRRRSLRKEGKHSLRKDAPGAWFELKAPDDTSIYPVKPNGVEGCWRWSMDTYKQKEKDGEVEWVKTNGK